jgi:hypothetical protein
VIQSLTPPPAGCTATAIERADRIGVVRPALVARNVPLHRPGLTAVERLVEAEEMVVALGADDPLALADQVARVVRVDPDVRL